MLVPAYVAGIVAVGFVVACFGLAREGAEGAKTASVIGVSVLLALASVAAFLGLVLLLAGQKIGEEEGWWTPAQGQQFVAATAGWLVLAGSGWSLGRRSYLLAAALTIVAAGLFGLWGLLVEAGWSGRGPLALVR